MKLLRRALRRILAAVVWTVALVLLIPAIPALLVGVALGRLIIYYQPGGPSREAAAMHSVALSCAGLSIDEAGRVLAASWARFVNEPVSQQVREQMAAWVQNANAQIAEKVAASGAKKPTYH